MSHYDKQRLEQQEKELQDWSDRMYSPFNDPLADLLKLIISHLIEIKREIHHAN